jgi:hypothetical protein
MGVEKFSVSFEPDLGQAVRDAADEGDQSVSAWLAAAARDRLRNLALGTALDELMAELELGDDEVLLAATEARERAVEVESDRPPARRAKAARPRAR